MLIEIELDSKRTYDVTLRSVRIFALWTLLRCLTHLIHWGYISCYYSPMSVYYIMLSSLLRFITHVYGTHYLYT
jgi:hypothetical protein